MNHQTLGNFEEVVMLTVAVLYGKAYGVSLQHELQNRMEKKVSIGAMRTALKRLEKKGFLTSYLGEATAVRGGKRKRYYQVTPYGKRVLEEAMQTRNELWEAIPTIAFDFKYA